MLFTMAVSLYTSRVVLNALGVEDYGTYNVVGGVIALFGFITASMGSATSRFLTYALGKNDDKKLKDTFAAALTIHLLIALVVLFFTETIGLWFLNNKLVIPEGRILAAKTVFHVSVFSTLLSVTKVPFTASVFSHEKMGVYAFVEIANSLLRLIAVSILVYVQFDKLIAYSLFLLTISILSFSFYILYTTKNFKECGFRISTNKTSIMPMLGFSGWDLYGNMSVVARTQGVNMLLNMFFGTVLNAASGIATQIQGALGAFASNILMAVRPQIVKSYAGGNKEHTSQLIYNTTKFTSLLLLVLFIPIIIEMPFILRIWLVNVPEYTVTLSRLTLTFSFLANISSVVMSGLHATGKIKRSSIWNGTLYLSVVPITYFAYKAGSGPIIPFVLNAIFVAIGASLNVSYFNKFVNEFSVYKYLRTAIIPVFIIGFIAASASCTLKQYITNNWVSLISITAINTFIILTLSYYFLTNKQQKEQVKNYISKWIKIKRK